MTAPIITDPAPKRRGRPPGSGKKNAAQVPAPASTRVAAPTHSVPESTMVALRVFPDLDEAQMLILARALNAIGMAPIVTFAPSGAKTVSV
jgi:hypothetical protein